MRLLALPYAPLPRRLVYLDAQRDAHHYRVRLRWDGAVRSPGGCVVVDAFGSDARHYDAETTVRA